MGQWRHHAAQKRDSCRETNGEELDAKLSFVWAQGNASARSAADEPISGELAMMMANALERLDVHYCIVLEMRFIDQRRSIDDLIALRQQFARFIELSAGVHALANVRGDAEEAAPLHFRV